MSVRADAKTLQSIPIFADCDPVHLQVMAFAAERQQFLAGEALIHCGETGDSAYLILSGQAEIRVPAARQNEIVGQAGPGAFIGEAAMIGDVPYSVTVTALTPLVAARIDRQLFMRVAGEYPEFGAAVFKALASKLDLAMVDLNAVRGHFEQAKPFSRR